MGVRESPSPKTLACFSPGTSAQLPIIEKDEKPVFRLTANSRTGMFFRASHLPYQFFGDPFFAA
jgi:hypothetical protein